MKILNSEYFIIILVIITYCILYNPAVYSKDAELYLSKDQSRIFYCFNYFSEELNEDINKKKLLELLASASYDFNHFSNDSVNELLKIAHSSGLFLNAFDLSNQQFSELAKIQLPFITFLDGKGWVVVKDINEIDSRYRVKVVLSKYEELTLGKKDFKERWNGLVLSSPLVNILTKKFDLSSNDPKGRYIIVYSFHSGEDFKVLKTILNDLRTEAEVEGKKLIYVDELGLIPKETVEGRMERLNISEEGAFNQIKESIFREDEMLEKGIPLNIGSEFYRKLYKWLANHKVKSLVEDLDYENWKDIVEFDEQYLRRKAINNFLSGNVQGYLKSVYDFTYGFMKYNVVMREHNFSRQIEKIMEEYPEAIIVTLRGIGHYGMAERVSNTDYTVESFVIADGTFKENLGLSDYLQVLWANDIEVEIDKLRIMLLRDFPQQILRNYLQKEFDSLSLIARISNKIVKRMEEEDIVKLSNIIPFGFLSGKINKNNINEFVVDYIKKEGFIIDEEFKFFSKSKDVE